MDEERKELKVCVLPFFTWPGSCDELKTEVRQELRVYLLKLSMVKRWS
jgi:hypothetical protein